MPGSIELTTLKGEDKKKRKDDLDDELSDDPEKGRGPSRGPSKKRGSATVPLVDKKTPLVDKKTPPADKKTPLVDKKTTGPPPVSSTHSTSSPAGSDPGGSKFPGCITWIIAAIIGLLVSYILGYRVWTGVWPWSSDPEAPQAPQADVLARHEMAVDDTVQAEERHRSPFMEVAALPQTLGGAARVPPSEKGPAGDLQNHQVPGDASMHPSPLDQGTEVPGGASIPPALVDQGTEVLPDFKEPDGRDRTLEETELRKACQEYCLLHCRDATDKLHIASSLWETLHREKAEARELCPFAYITGQQACDIATSFHGEVLKGSEVVNLIQTCGEKNVDIEHIRFVQDKDKYQATIADMKAKCL